MPGFWYIYIKIFYDRRRYGNYQHRIKWLQDHKKPGNRERDNSPFTNIAAGFQTLFGGKISIYQELCEKTREDAFQLMLQQATEKGANAVICMRYDANEIMGGVTEVLAYGTAVVVEKL